MVQTLWLTRLITPQVDNWRDNLKIFNVYSLTKKNEEARIVAKEQRGKITFKFLFVKD